MPHPCKNCGYAMEALSKITLGLNGDTWIGYMCGNCGDTEVIREEV